jgi:hypothetical protein
LLGSSPFFILLPATQQEAFRRKFGVAIRLIHRAPFVSAADLFSFTREEPLDNYVKRYISKRLKKMSSSDPGSSVFLQNIFFWDNFHKYKNDGVGHLFTLKRMKRLKLKNCTLLIEWLNYNQEGERKVIINK